MNTRWLSALVLLLPACAHADVGDWYATVYGARISTQPGWEDIITDAPGTEFVDSYLATVAVSRQYAAYKGGALALEAEGQVVYHFHDQTLWEFNAVPIVLRWRRFPWSHNSIHRRLSVSACRMPPKSHPSKWRSKVKAISCWSTGSWN